MQGKKNNRKVNNTTRLDERHAFKALAKGIQQD